MRALLMYERRKVSRFAERRRKKMLAFGALSFVMAMSFFVLLAFLSHRPDYQIQKIDVHGNALVSSVLVAGTADHILSGSYLKLFSKRNIFLLPKRELENSLQEEFPALDSVQIERVPFSGLSITVHEREPFAVWCPSEAPGESQCYFVDQEGLVFNEAPDFSRDAYIRFVGTIASTTALGENLFPAERFREIVYFLQSLGSLGLSPKTVLIEGGIAGTSDFEIMLASGVRLLISGSENLEKTLANISTFFSDDAFATSSGGVLESVDYIDFRFKDKVYYKSHGE